MGHIFGLAHHDSGIMGRDFDFIDEFFLANNSQFSKHRLKKWWSPSALVILDHSPWFNDCLTNDCDESHSNKDSLFQVSLKSNNVIRIKSTHGIVVVEVRIPPDVSPPLSKPRNEVIYHEIFNFRVTIVRLNPSSVPSLKDIAITRNCFFLFAMDIRGNSITWRPN